MLDNLRGMAVFQASFVTVHLVVQPKSLALQRVQ